METPITRDMGHLDSFRRFLSRYVALGTQGVTDVEVAEWYQQIAGVMDGDAYERAAVDTLEGVAPGQRLALRDELQRLADDSGLAPDLATVGDEPHALAQMLRTIHQRGPSLTELISGPSGPAASPGGKPDTALVRGVLAGIAASGGAQLIANPHQATS